MQKKLLIALLLVMQCCALSAQKQDYVWFFGDSILFDFNSGSPALGMNAKLKAEECSSSICDGTGNLLLYANEIDIFDRTGTLMQNGAGQYPGNAPWDQSITQGVMILNHPDYEGRYYVFRLRHNQNRSNLRFTVSIVEIAGNAGYGEVISKDSILYSSSYLSEKMSAVRHANGKDWWILIHPSSGDEFLEFSLTNNGLQGPTAQNIGQVYGTEGGSAGQMVFSRKGDKMLAVSGDVIDLFDFDRCTGQLSNHTPISEFDGISGNNLFYGCSFSPNGEIIYVSDGGGQYNNRIFQFDLTQPNISASQTLLYDSGINEYVMPGLHLLGPDNLIYIASYHFSPLQPSTPFNQNLSFITNPDSVGIGCGLQMFQLSVVPYRSSIGLPNIPNYRLGPIYAQAADAGPDQETCPGDPIQIGTPDTCAGRCVFTWSPADGLDNPNIAQPTVNVVTAQGGDSMLYVLTVTDTSADSDCATTYDTVIVRFQQCPPEIPNVFTPNGDGINETFYITQLPPQTQVAIYDRWGKQVYSSPNYNNDWDGDGLPEGVYYYVVAYPTRQDGVPHQEAGHVSLLR